jgi:hypothetical protein
MNKHNPITLSLTLQIPGSEAACAPDDQGEPVLDIPRMDVLRNYLAGSLELAKPKLREQYEQQRGLPLILPLRAKEVIGIVAQMIIHIPEDVHCSCDDSQRPLGGAVTNLVTVRAMKDAGIIDSYRSIAVLVGGAFYVFNNSELMAELHSNLSHQPLDSQKSKWQPIYVQVHITTIT